MTCPRRAVHRDHRTTGVHHRRRTKGCEDANDNESCTRKTGRAERDISVVEMGLLSTPHPHPKSSSAFTMAFKLHGWSISTCTRRVALIAKERNVPYELIQVNLQGGEHKQPAYLAHQPFGQIPYISVRRSASPLILSFPSLMTFPLSSSSRTTASSCSSRVLSVATSRPSGPAQS